MKKKDALNLRRNMNLNSLGFLFTPICPGEGTAEPPTETTNRHRQNNSKKSLFKGLGKNSLITENLFHLLPAKHQQKTTRSFSGIEQEVALPPGFADRAWHWVPLPMCWWGWAGSLSFHMVWQNRQCSDNTVKGVSAECESQLSNHFHPAARRYTQATARRGTKLHFSCQPNIVGS